MLKHSIKSDSETFQLQKKLIELSIEKFHFNVCVVCAMPTLENVEQSRDENE